MQKSQPKKTNLSPAAAKVLEQYRNAGKTANNVGAAPVEEDDQGASRTSAPPPANQMRRSGTRGK